MQKMYALLRRIWKFYPSDFEIMKNMMKKWFLKVEDGLGEVRFSNLRFRIDLEF